MKFTRWYPEGTKIRYFASVGKGISEVGELRDQKIPFRGEISNKADQKLIIASLGGVENGIELLAGRFSIKCKTTGTQPGCFYSVNSLNYAMVQRGSEGSKDQERVTRGSPYGSSVKADWNVFIIGSVADTLYDALGVEGGKYLTKRVTFSPDKKINCHKRPNASDPYTVCNLTIEDNSTNPFGFPGGINWDYADSDAVFPEKFSFKSKYGVLSVDCQGHQKKQLCKMGIRYLD
jgi:hypothetical protein